MTFKELKQNDKVEIYKNGILKEILTVSNRIKSIIYFGSKKQCFFSINIKNQDKKIIKFKNSFGNEIVIKTIKK